MSREETQLDLNGGKDSDDDDDASVDANDADRTLPPKENADAHSNEDAEVDASQRTADRGRLARNGCINRMRASGCNQAGGAYWKSAFR
mmetsp:Transcript_20293/g.57623  ORF Transcript_20293/g.57623 Transcript_20293/m.57623 type:complete len:89 (-) Transcript_20293:30-296(-)